MTEVLAVIDPSLITLKFKPQILWILKGKVYCKMPKRRQWGAVLIYLCEEMCYYFSTCSTTCQMMFPKKIIK